MPQQKVVIFIGTQGAGKGTQFKLLRQFLEEHDPTQKVFCFDTGQSLRELHSREGYAYHKMQRIMDNGLFLPDWIPQWLLSTKMINSFTKGQSVLIDGFPRSVGQAQAIKEITDFYELSDVYVLNMSVSEEVAIERALSRGREDDTVEAVKSRLQETHRVLQPVLDYLSEETDFGIHHIDGAQHIEKVTEDIFTALELKK